MCVMASARHPLTRNNNKNNRKYKGRRLKEKSVSGCLPSSPASCTQICFIIFEKLDVEYIKQVSLFSP